MTSISSVKLDSGQKRRDVFANGSTSKALSMKNRSAATKWQQLVDKIELQMLEKSTEHALNCSKLLDKQKELLRKTASLPCPNDLRHREEESVPAFLKVYNNLMTSMSKTAGTNSSNSDKCLTGSSITRPTQSSQRKRALRKNVSFSLLQLQKGKSEHKITEPKNKMISGNEIRKDDNESISAGVVDEQEGQKSEFEYTKEDLYINRKLYCSPLVLPKLHEQVFRRPRFRSFDKEKFEYRKQLSLDETSWEDLHRCRYLRVRQKPSNQD